MHLHTCITSAEMQWLMEPSIRRHNTDILLLVPRGHDEEPVGFGSSPTAGVWEGDLKPWKYFSRKSLWAGTCPEPSDPSRAAKVGGG